MRPHPYDRAVTAAVAVPAAVLVLLLGACAADPDEPAAETSAPSSPSASAGPGSANAEDEGSSPGRLEATDVPFTEPSATAPPSSDVPATLYAVLADRLDPRGEHLASYDGSNDPATGVGAGEVPDGWSLNAEWRPRGLVGLYVADSWPEGWVCVDAYPGCRAIELGDGGTAQALPVGRNTVSVGFEQPGGSKVVVSSVSINELSTTDLAAVASDERLDLP